MTKTAAIEATAIIALEKEKDLKKYFPQALIEKAKGYLHEPGISVLKEAGLAAGLAGVHALHDPTEGGIATAVFEMAEASSLGAVVHEDRIPVSEETRALCAHYGLDPLGAFASGALLMAVSPRDVEEVMEALASAEIRATRIGTMVKRQKGLKLIKGGRALPLPIFHQDELSRLLD